MSLSERSGVCLARVNEAQMIISGAAAHLWPSCTARAPTAAPLLWRSWPGCGSSRRCPGWGPGPGAWAGLRRWAPSPSRRWACSCPACSTGYNLTQTSRVKPAPLRLNGLARRWLWGQRSSLWRLRMWVWREDNEGRIKTRQSFKCQTNLQQPLNVSVWERELGSIFAAAYQTQYSVSLQGFTHTHWWRSREASRLCWDTWNVRVWQSEQHEFVLIA